MFNQNNANMSGQHNIYNNSWTRPRNTNLPQNGQRHNASTPTHPTQPTQSGMFSFQDSQSQMPSHRPAPFPQNGYTHANSHHGTGSRESPISRSQQPSYLPHPTLGKRGPPSTPETPHKHQRHNNYGASGGEYIGYPTAHDQGFEIHAPQPQQHGNVDRLTMMPSPSASDEDKAPKKASKALNAIELSPGEDLQPPGWLNAGASKANPRAFRPQYSALDSSSWPTFAMLDNSRQSMFVRPNCGSADIVQDETGKTAIAIRFYNAIIDPSGFFASIGGPVGWLLEGKYTTGHMQVMCVELVKEVIKFHTQGLFVPSHSDLNRDALSGIQKKDSEQNDSFTDRVNNIEHALRWCKLVACDVLNQKVGLAQAIVLAPKKRIISKMNYGNSNWNRAKKTKERNAKIEEFEAKENQQM